LLDRFFKERQAASSRPVPARAAARPALSEAAAELQLARILTCLLLRHPALLRDEEETFAALALPPPLRGMQHAMLAWLDDAQTLDAASLMDHLRASGHADDADLLTAAVRTALPPGAREGAMPAEALETFWHFVGLLRRSSLQEELSQAQQAFARRCDDATQRRVIALRNVQQRLYAGDPAGS
jgi:hypothetical protein